MIQTLPADTFVATFSGLDTGLSAGFQIQRASTGTVVQVRTTTGVIERPAGSGNYVITGAAPVEEGVYLLVIDWNGGVITPDTSVVEELKVTMTLEIADSGLGPIADAAKTHLGETFEHLKASEHYGESEITKVVNRVKRRALTAPPATADEDTLDDLVIDYLGELVALALIEPAYHYYANQHQTVSMGEDPTEVASYPDRIRMLEKVQAWLLSDSRSLLPDVQPLLKGARLRSADDGPAIDEGEDGLHVTADPRTFPGYNDYPVKTVVNG